MNFIYGLQKHQINPDMPNTAYLLPAHLYWSRRGFVAPNLPSHLTNITVDSGAFAFKEFPCSLAEYVRWLQLINPVYAVMQDYITFHHGVEIAQARTIVSAYQTWEHYASEAWRWIPVLHGATPQDYRHHAQEMKPLLLAMREKYGDAMLVGVGSLLRKDMTITKRAHHVNSVMFALSGVLPWAKFHGFGVSAGLVQRICAPNLHSGDSTNWSPGGRQYIRQSYEAAKRRESMGISKAQDAFINQMPEYRSTLDKAHTRAPKQFQAMLWDAS